MTTLYAFAHDTANRGVMDLTRSLVQNTFAMAQGGHSYQSPMGWPGTSLALVASAPGDIIGGETLFEYPSNETLADPIALLPAEQHWVRDRIHGLSRNIAAKSNGQRRLEVEMGISLDMLEPQVAWASQVLAIKGYLPGDSGFCPWLGSDRVYRPTIDSVILWHVIDDWIHVPTPEEIAIIESVPGAFYDRGQNGIIVSAAGKPLAEVKVIFDEVARRLPDRGQWMRARSQGMGRALQTPNRHFVMVRELWHGKEYSVSREQYLADFLWYLKDHVEVTGTVSIGQEIVNQVNEGVEIDEEFVRQLLKDAISDGKVVILEEEEVLDHDGLNIMSMVQEVFSQEGNVIQLAGEAIIAHPGFRLVFWLNEEQTTILTKATGKDCLRFDFPMCPMTTNV